LGENVFYQITRTRLLLMNAFSTGHSTSDVFHYMLDMKRLVDISRNMMTQSLLQYTWFRHFPNTLKPALRVNQEVMRLFKQMCDENHIRLTFVIVPTKIQIEPEDIPVLPAITAYDPTYTLESQVAFEDMYVNAIKKAGEELGVEVIDPRNEMIAQKSAKRLYLQQDMHLSVEGDRIVGEILAERFRRVYQEGGGEPHRHHIASAHH
jgi:hypothetical protein